jgi:FtsZ-interacting cell division protein YlmF
VASTEKGDNPLPSEQLSSSWFEQAQQKERFPDQKASLGNLFGPLHHIGVVNPSSFDEGAQDLAKRFKRPQAIVLNLQQADAELAKRMVDFCAGLAYALDGAIHPIAHLLFLLTPAEIEFSSRESSRIIGGRFYNQS